MSELKLEIRAQQNLTQVFTADGTGAAVMTTPPLDEDYWAYRVRLTDRQAIVGFPKFTTIGIGFAREDDDWNLNLPYSTAEQIYKHIRRNQGDETITEADCVAAIALIQQAVRRDRDSAS